MMISLCNEVIRELDFAEQCRFAKALGYDGLELAPFTLADEPHRLPKARRKELETIAADHGIAITGLHWLLLAPEGLSITSPDDAVRARTLDVMRGLIELCNDLAGGVLVHGSPKQRQIEEGDAHEAALARARDCFAAIADDARQAGVVYCIEPLARAETLIINSVAEAAAIVDEIGSPHLRTMIDCAAAGRSEAEPPHALIDEWLPSGHIAHVHLNDPNRKSPGQGDMAFAPIMRSLHRNNYVAVCGIEPFVYEPDGPTSAARAIGYIQGIRETLVP